MKKNVSITALAGKDEIIYIDNAGNMFAANEKNAEYIGNAGEIYKQNPIRNSIGVALSRLSFRGYKIAQEFPKASYEAFKTARKNYLRDKMIHRDFLELNAID